MPRDEIDTIYEEVDVDRNGVISEAEFSNWFFAEEVCAYQAYSVQSLM